MVQLVFRKVGVFIVTGLLLVLMTSCASTPPSKSNNLCSIFKEKRSWHKAALRMEEQWSVPVHVPMAMMYQESRFVANAKAPRTYTFFGLIPWGRESSAFGYSQALDGTWNHYREDTGQWGADRDDFADALDFMGWYINNTRKLNGISHKDAYTQYLNYHEGWAGFRSGGWKKKQWLKDVSARVNLRASRYASQYQGCREELSRGFWYRLFH